METISRPSRHVARECIRAATTFHKFAPLSLFLIFPALFAAALTSLSHTNQRSRSADFAGTAKCLSCHQDKKGFLETSHQLTSRLPTKTSIGGKFSDGENILKTSNPDLYYKMESRKDGFYQTAVLGTPPDAVSFSKRFDIVIGSGRKGQTFLFWSEPDLLFQLPVSYWTELRKWVYSPGFEDGSMDFGRPISPRCLECHASFFEPRSDTSAVNRFNKTNYTLGISCEKCHGPGQEHVARQLSGMAKSSGQAIVNLTKLPRARQVEVCGLCHGGLGIEKVPAFSYVPGEPLADYIHLKSPEPNEIIDSHGNQVALLERSRCFQSSTMTCTTCHNVHLTQRNAAAFSDNCLACHKIESCGVYLKKGKTIAENCIDCHMPKLASNVIVSAYEGKKAQPQVRTHWIKVYPEIANPH